MSDFLYISIGTYTPTFEDLTISIHIDDVSAFTVTLTPQDTKRLLEWCMGSIGTDSSEMLKIKLNKTILASYSTAAMLYRSDLEIEKE